MNTLDLFILGAAFIAALGGYRLGFVARAASWLCMALGLLLAARLLPRIIEALEGGDQVRLLFTALGVLVAGAFIGQGLGLLIGTRLHLAIPAGPARVVDRVAGAGAGALGVLVAVWLLIPTMAEIPDWPAQQARNSSIAKAVDSLFPDPPDTVQALRRLVGDDQFPQVFDALRPAPDLGTPPVDSGISQALADQVAPSTVKVEGTACRRVQEGSGFVAGPELVVTNAHVVAGETETQVQRTDGSIVEAAVVAFDPARDLAVLRAPGLNRPALPIGDAVAEGDRGGVFGHPGGGPLRIAPYQLGREVTATGRDIYDSSTTERQVLFIAADLAPGDSGGPLVDPAGAVVGVAFAIAPDEPGVAYALTTDELEAVLGGNLGAPVNTGPCLA